MDIGTQLADAAGRALAAHGAPDALARAEDGRWPVALWDDLMGLGLGEALVGADGGGHGLGWADMAATFTALGRHACPAPIGEHMIARALLDRAGLDAPEGVLALSAAVGQRPRLADGRLHGALRAVVWGKAASHVVVEADDADGVSALALAPAAAMEGASRRTVSRTPHADFVLDGAEVRAAPAPEGSVALAGALLRSLQIAGAIERVLEETVAYANARVQFGKPIGRFQAVQQIVAELGNEAAAASAVSAAAAQAMDRGEERLAVACAKARTSVAAGRAAAIAHEVHAAIGVTREFGLHHLTRRLWQWHDDFGNEFLWRAELGRAAATAGAEGLWPLIVTASGGVDAQHAGKGAA